MKPLLLTLGLGAATALAQNSTTPGQTCVVPSNYDASNGTEDDSPAINSAFEKCGHGGTVVFEEGVSYSIFKPIIASNLSDVTIQMHGNLHLSKDVEATREMVNSSSSTFYWFLFAGQGIHWDGPKNINNGWIRSFGQAWWDLNPPGGTGISGRPHLMSYTTKGGSIKRLRSSKPVAWNVQIKGSDIDIEDVIVDAVSDKWESFPFNTDGLGIGAQNVRIKNLISYNGDDAVAINNGAQNVYVTDSTIGYQTHGLSIGSLGKNQAQFANVSNIHFDRITVAGGLYAARFKSWIGGQGLVSNVSWTNIHVHNVTFPIFINQQYVDQNSAGEANRPNNSSVVLQDFKFADFSGDINSFNPGDGSCATDPCWYDQGLPNLKQTEGIIIECNTETSCSGFETSNINLYPQKEAESPTVICMHATAQLNPGLGFDCANGTYVPIE